MAALFLIVLVVAWIGICLPAATRARTKGPLESTALFKRGLELIGPAHHPEFVRTLGRPPAPAPGSAAGPRPGPDVKGHVSAAPVPGPRPVSASAQPGVVRQDPTRPESPLAVRRGRALVLLCLAAFVLLSAGFAIVEGMWEPHLAADSLLAIYVSWLLEDKHRRSERARKVTSLRAARQARAPEPLRAVAGER